jgi:hypothetical protein
MRIPLALGALLVLAVAAHSALGPRYGGEVTIAVGSLPAALEPSPPRTTAERAVAGLVHETLVTVGDDALPHPALAEGWSSAAEGREWTLRLRRGARFHDGDPVTAEDVVRSLRAFLRGPSAAAAAFADEVDGGADFRRGARDALPGLASPDASTVVVRGTGAGPARLAALGAAAAAVVSRRGAGAGPFAPLTPSLRSGTALVAFDGHVRGRPFVDRVRVIESASAGSDDAARRVDLGAAAAGSGPGGAASVTLLLILDPAHAPFAGAAARVAVARAVDRISLARHFLPLAEPSWTLVPPSVLPAPPAPAAAPPADRVPGRLVLRVATDVPAAASQRVVAQFDALGLATQVVAVPPALVLAGPAGARLFLWSPEVAEPSLAVSELVELAARFGGRAAEAGLGAARQALRAAAAQPGDDARRVHLMRAEEALRGPGVLIPLAALPVALRVGEAVHGVRADAAARVLLEDAWVEP